MWCVIPLSVWFHIITSCASEMTTDQVWGDGNRETRRLELFRLIALHVCVSEAIAVHANVLSDLWRMCVVRRIRLRSWETLAADPLLLRPPLRVLVSKTFSGTRGESVRTQAMNLRWVAARLASKKTKINVIAVDQHGGCAPPYCRTNRLSWLPWSLLSSVS